MTTTLKHGHNPGAANQPRGSKRSAVPTCFHEADPNIALTRRALGEGLGTLLLALSASGGGMAATRLFPGQPGAAVVMIAITVAGSLVSLIVAFGKISGGHYNPLITTLQLLEGTRSLKCSAAYIAAQMVGGAIGGYAAARLWDAAPASALGLGWSGFASELIASIGLMLVVFGCTRSGRADTGPFAVGAWLFAAIIATPSGSYANPAVVVGALASSGPIALGPGSVLPYISAELLGALLALVVIELLFPRHEATS
jgi:glycerol uptake facilitator-like aquaporin